MVGFKILPNIKARLNRIINKGKIQVSLITIARINRENCKAIAKIKYQAK